MRITGGKLKGKTINFLKNTTTRPLKDSVKESIFNILIHSNLLNINLEKSSVLDLYSGIGSFGIECISRGAENIIFVERDLIAVKILKENLSNLTIQNRATIETGEISNFLKKNHTKRFEIFFLDPPFVDDEYIAYLNLIYKKKIYKPNHVVILHRERNNLDPFHEIIDPLIIREYGRSKIIFGKFLD